MSKATCSDHLAESLIASGVDYVVGIPGHGNLVLADAVMARQDRLPWILVRHEQSAAHMADGYFRACGRPPCYCNVNRPRSHEYADRRSNGLRGLVGDDRYHRCCTLLSV